MVQKSHLPTTLNRSSRFLMLGLWGDVELSGWGSLEESWSFILEILMLGDLHKSADVSDLLV